MNSNPAGSRRRFLGTAAGLSSGLALSAGPAQPAAPLLPTVQFGKSRVTRLIIGSNPFYGYSHFNRLLDQFIREWMTQDQRMEILRSAERNGIGTWQLHYNDPTIADLKRYRAEGGRMNWFLLSDFALQNDFALIPVVAKLGPIGIAYHGGRTDDAFRNGKMDRVEEFCKRVRDTGVLAGVSTHNPRVVEWIEEKGWDIDYYMTCLYQVSRTRAETRALLGEAPLGELFLEKDPERMTAAIRATRRPCLAFKLLGAGRTIANPAQVEAAFRFAFENIKATDAVIVGMCPRFHDEVAENAGFVRKLAGVPS